MSLKFARIKNKAYLCNRKPQKQGEMAEWSIAAVLKTVEGHTSGGSNPSLSAASNNKPAEIQRVFFYHKLLVPQMGAHSNKAVFTE